MAPQDGPGSNSPRNKVSQPGAKLVSTSAPKVASVMGKSTADVCERWYLRIDGSEFGPATRTQLEQFLRPPRLCSFMQVMCTVQPGVWHSIARHETLDKVLQRFGIDAVRTPQPTSERPNSSSLSRTSMVFERIRQLQEDAFDLVTKYRTGLIVVAAIVVVDVVAFIALADPTGRERDIVQRYESVAQSIRQFSKEKSSSEEWGRFAKNAIKEIEPILKELQRTANPRRSVPQNLLLGGRDHLLPILKGGEPPTQESMNFRLFERRLQLSKDELKRAGGPVDQQLIGRIP